MPSDKERSWLLLSHVVETGEHVDVSGSTLVNLNTVRRAVITGASEIRLFYTPDHVEIIQGAAATEIMTLLLSRAMLPTGDPFEFPSDDKPPSA